MDKLITTDLGGFPIKLNDLRWFLGQENNHGIYQALNNMLRGFGNDFIIQGCQENAGIISEGWILLGGELLKVEQHNRQSFTHYSKKTISEPTGNKTFLLGGTFPTWQKNRAIVDIISGNLRFDGLRIENIIDNRANIRAMATLNQTLAINIVSSPESVMMKEADQSWALSTELFDVKKIVLSNPISYLKITGSPTRAVIIRRIEKSTNTPDGWKMILILQTAGSVIFVNDKQTFVDPTFINSNLKLLTGVMQYGTTMLTLSRPRASATSESQILLNNYFGASSVTNIHYDKKVFITLVWDEANQMWDEVTRSGRQ